MKPHFTRRGLCLAALVALLCGCVAFEQSPVADLSCDPALAGTWTDADGGSSSRHRFTVDAKCRLRWPKAPGGPFAMTLRGFALDGHRYLVLTPAEADVLAEAEGDVVRQTPAGHVYLVRYRVAGKSARMRVPDWNAARAAVARGAVKGRRMYAEDEESVILTGDSTALAKVLRTQGGAMFGSNDDEDATMHFKRVAKAKP